MKEKPNILFIFTDDQRFNTINILNNKEIITPNIDKLVKGGTTFTHAHIAGGTVGAVCMPSRAMLNTGRSLFHIEDRGICISPDHSTIGEHFLANGYNCFGIGKWHNGKDSYRRSFSGGGEIYFGGPMDHWNIPLYDYDPSGKYDKSMPYIKDPYSSNEVSQRPGDHITNNVHSTDNIAAKAIDVINNYKEEDPFYMYLAFLAPHDPRSMPQKYLDLYDNVEISLPENFTGGHPFDNGELYVRDEKLAPFPREQDDTLRHIKEYYAMITHVDDKIGEIVDVLEKKGILENTIIVFSGDNGLAIGQHGLFGKQNCYEHSIRVPLIFSGPGIPENSQTDSYAYLFDIFPTLCELTNISIPESVEGKSLLQLIKNPDKEIRDKMYFAYKDCQRAVKDRRFKLIEYVVGGRNNMTQLFDLEKDPWEKENLAFDPLFKDKLDELRKNMFEFREQWDDNLENLGETFWEGFENKNKINCK